MTALSVALLVLMGLAIASVALLVPRRNKALQRLIGARAASDSPRDARVATARRDKPFEALLNSLYTSTGISPRPLGFVVGVPIGLALIGLVVVIAGSPGVGGLGLILIILGPAIVYLDSSRRGAGRRKAFSEGLPQFLLTVASAMSAGLTLEQALRELSAGSAGVVEQEFHRVVQTVALGETLESALGDLSARMASSEIDTLRQATAIGRETGSSLTPILETVAESSLERAQVRREIGTLTAEGMMSAYVVIALPFLVFVFLLLSQPDYVSVLWTRPAGIGMTVAAITLIAGGWFWLRRLISQETSSL